MLNVKRIRKDFPILQKKIKGRPIVYFDNACMSLRPRQVIDAVECYYKNYPACVGRSSHTLGRWVTERYQEARKIISKFIGAKEKEIIFTRNTTEGINLVANSLGLKKGDVVLTSDREHNSNLLPWQLLAKRVGIKHRIVSSNEDMTFDIHRFENCMSKKVKLVSMVYTSNLDGYTLPVKEIIDIAHDYGSLVLLDGAQAVPHKKINVKKLDVDFLAFSGHKMLGPSGTGVLYGKYHLLEELEPFIVGGDTVRSSTYDSCEFLEPPERFEGGLQNYAGMIGLAEACKYLERVGLDKIEKHEKMLNEIITEGIAGIKGLSIIGPPSPELRSGIVSFTVDGMNPHDIALLLDELANVMIRSGQHCVHSWFNAHKIEGSARASLYLYNTKEEAKIFINTLKKIISLR